MGHYAGVDYNSLYLIVNSIVSYPPQQHRETGGGGKISHICMSGNFQIVFLDLQPSQFVILTSWSKDDVS
jgi:hypothetical protein